MAFGLGCLGGGVWGQGLLLGPPLEDPIPAAGPGVWVGESPSVARKTTPPWALSPSGGNSEGGLSSGPTPSPSTCPQSGVVGEVANRFPGQHRGRLGWSSGQQGKSQVSPGTPPNPLPWAYHPAVTAPFGPAAPQTPLVSMP